MGPVNENLQRSVAIYKELQHADSTILDALQWEDRSIISIALNNLMQSDPQPISDAQFKHVCQSLQGNPPSLGYMQRMWNVAANYFQFQTSPSAILALQKTIREKIDLAPQISVALLLSEQRLSDLKATNEVFEERKDSYLKLSHEIDDPNVAADVLKKVQQQIRDEGILTVADQVILLLTAPLDEHGRAKVTQYIGRQITKLENEREPILRQMKAVEGELKELVEKKTQLEKELPQDLTGDDEVFM